MSVKLDPCEIVLQKNYPERNKTELKEDRDFIKKVTAILGDRTKIRQFVDDFVIAKRKEINIKMLSNIDTLSKFSMNMDRLNDPKWGKDIVQGALSLYEQTSSVVEGAGINVDALMAAKFKRYWGKAISEIEALDLLPAFRSGELDIPVREVIRSGKPDTSAAATDINNMAAILKKYYSLMNKELNAAGFRVAYRADYDGQIVHDGTKIYGNFFDWAKSIDEAIHLEKEFIAIGPNDFKKFREDLKSGTLPEEGTEIQQLLKQMYDRITKKYAHPDELNSLARPVSMAERRARAKTFTQWKSGEAVQNYLSKYGKYSTLGQQLENYTRIASKDAALVTIFGAVPSKGHAMVKDYVKELMIGNGESSVTIDAALRKLDNAWDLLTKPNPIPENLAAEIMGNTRNISAIAKLGRAGITSLFMDPAVTSAQTKMLLNEGLVQNVFSTFKNYFGAHREMWKGADLEAMYLYSKFDLLALHEEFQNIANGRTGQALRVASEMVSKWSGARWNNGAAHIANAKKWTYEISKFPSMEDMDKVLKADLEKFDINDNDLQVIKGLNTEEYGMKNVLNLTTEKYTELSKKTFKSTTEAEYALANFQDRVSVWLLDKIRTGAPVPGLRERRLLGMGTRAGSIEGEVVRFFNQFKTTQHKIWLDTVVAGNRRLNPEGIQTGNTLGNYINKPNGWHLGYVLASFTMAGALTKLLNDILTTNEDELKRWEEGDPSLFLDAFSRGGAAYILGDAFSFKASKSQMLSQTIGTPAINAAIEIPHSIGTAVTGDPDKAALDLGKAFVPGANLWMFGWLVQGMTEATKKTRSKSSGTSGRKRL